MTEQGSSVLSGQCRRGGVLKDKLQVDVPRKWYQYHL